MPLFGRKAPEPEPEPVAQVPRSGKYVSPPPEAAERKVFARFDLDGSGSLEAPELGPALREMGFDGSAAAVKETMRQHDADGNRKLDFDEFAALVAELRAAADAAPAMPGGPEPGSPEFKAMRKAALDAMRKEKREKAVDSDEVARINARIKAAAAAPKPEKKAEVKSDPHMQAMAAHINQKIAAKSNSQKARS